MREADGCLEVDVLGEIGAIIPQWVVRKPRKVDDCVETRHIIDDNVSDVLLDCRRFRKFADEGAGAENVAIKPRNRMAAIEKHRGQDGADIAPMAGQ